MNAALILAEGVTDGVVIDLLRALGWTPLATLPPVARQLGQERVLAAWDGPDGAQAELVDDALVRVLHVRDATEATIAVLGTLPIRSADDVLDQLGSLDPRRVAVAAHAAAIIGDPGLVLGLAPLRHHPDAAVRAESVEALQRMLPDLAADGLALLDDHARQGGGRGWAAAIPPRARRQAVRRLIHQLQGDDPTAALRAAFADPDWEVQAGAVIACVRGRVRELGGLVKRWQPPATSRHGVCAEDRSLLRALGRVATAELAGISPPDGGGRDPARLAEWRHLADSIAGRPTMRRDRIWMALRSLSEPIMIPSDLPAPRPGWCYVPAVEHWLGGDHQAPVRAVPGPAAWIATVPLRSGGTWWLGTWAEAVARASAGGHTIPDATAWECAARGCDGRRYPWGAGLDADHALAASPWGCSGYGLGWEWVRGADGPELRGGDEPEAGWMRRSPIADQRARLRPMAADPPEY